MRKKWTYVAVACMLLGTAPVFTGCIDTDEPAGLEDLRGAKSELLRAKAAVEAAKVAEVEAQAALLQAQAKVEEANAVKAQAEAEKIKAEAAIAQAKADYINAKTEEAKAEAQAKIDENNRLQAEWEEKAAVRQAEAEAAIKEAELRAATALANYQKVLVALQGVKDDVLTPYINRLNTATTEYYAALDVLRQKQRDLNAWQTEADKANNPEYKDLKTRDLQRELMLKQKAYEGVEAAIARVNEEIAEADKLTESDLAKKYDAVLEEQRTIQKEIADLSVQAAEEAVEIFNKQVIPYRALLQEIEDMKAEPQEIAAVTFDFGSNGDYYPLFVERGPIELEESEYTYNDLAYAGNAYEDRKDELEFWLDEFKSWTRDKNDDAWTNERIAELEGLLAANEKTNTELKDAWQQAVNAYRTGKYNTTDPSKIEGYKDVTDAITAFNTAATTVNEAYATYAGLTTQMQKDEETRDKTLAQNITDYTKAYTQAETDYQAALETADADFESTLKALQDNVKKAQENYDAAKKALDEADITDLEAYQEALLQEQVAAGTLKAATDAAANFTMNSYLQGLVEARDKAQQDALTAKLTADNAARKAYDDKWDPAKGTEYAKIKPAADAITTALKTLDSKRDDLVDAANAYNDALPELTGADTPISIAQIYAAATPTVDSKLGYEQVKANLAADKLIALGKDALENVIMARSIALYGAACVTTDYEDELISRLEVWSDEDIKAAVDEAVKEQAEDQERNVTWYDYLYELNSYGLAGQRLELKERIRIAKSWLTNSEAISGKIAEAEAALKALTDAHDALEADIEAKEDERDLAWETLQADLKETYAPADAKRQELEPLQGLLNAISHAITDYINAGDKIYGDETVPGTGIIGIDDFKAQLQKQKEGLELELFDAETLLKNAQANLDGWNNGTLNELQLAQQAVEDAQIIVDRKKAALDAVQSALDAVIAALTNDPTASTTTEE